MNTTSQTLIRGGAVALLFVSSIAMAEVSESLRGIIESVDSQTLLVKARNGRTTKVKLVNGVHVFTLKPASFADIKSGSFVGIVTKPQANGTESAAGIYIFPGDPEQDPFDIPTSGLVTPSDAGQVLEYVEGSISKNDGQTLTVRRQVGDATIPASADARIVAVTPATIADITPGQKFFVPNGRPVSFGIVAPTIILGE